jgi:hypothetical protein
VTGIVSSPSWPGLFRPSAHERQGADGRNRPGHDGETKAYVSSHCENGLAIAANTLCDCGRKGRPYAIRAYRSADAGQIQLQAVARADLEKAVCGHPEPAWFKATGPGRLSIFPDHGGAVRPNTPGPIDAVGACHGPGRWWPLVNDHGAVGSSTSCPVNPAGTGRRMSRLGRCQCRDGRETKRGDSQQESVSH